MKISKHVIWNAELCNTLDTLYSLIISLIIASCTDPNIIGLEVQPESDKIIINDTSNFSWQESQTEIQDSINTTKLIIFNSNDSILFI